MNSNTKKVLEDFIDEVQFLAMGTILTTGMDTANKLKQTLHSDETIIETR